MKILALILLTTGCTLPRYQRVVDPMEALRLCGDTGVKRYSAITGNVTCRKELKL